jgi:uncharacterized protein (DUF1499 family)
MIPSYLIAVLMVVGVLGANLGVLAPGAGFGLFAGGVALSAASAAALGGAAAVASALGKPWRRRALLGSALPLLVTLWLVGGRALNPVPTINDVTTDLADPPAFREGEAAGQSYHAEFEPLQRASYPQVQPIQTPESREQAFVRALAAAQAMPGWEVTRSDAAAGEIEAVAISRLFRFRDDVAIRVRSDASGARVDVRSRSRLGRSDLGANAARIQAFRESLRP